MTDRFGTETAQLNLPWYYDHPFLGALILAGIPMLGFATLIIMLMETHFAANETRRELADLSLQLHHTGYILPGLIETHGTGQDPL